MAGRKLLRAYYIISSIAIILILAGLVYTILAVRDLKRDDRIINKNIISNGDDIQGLDSDITDLTSKTEDICNGLNSCY